MVNWDLILVRLQYYLKMIYPQLFVENMPLKEVLTVLYELGLSTTDLCDATKGEASSVTIGNKMKEFGITMRSRGGLNYVKVIPMTREEYETNTNTALGKKYGVRGQTIHKHAKKMGWPLKKPGFRFKVVLL